MDEYAKLDARNQEAYQLKDSPGKRRRVVDHLGSAQRLAKPK